MALKIGTLRFVGVCVENETEMGCQNESSEIMQLGFEENKTGILY